MLYFEENPQISIHKRTVFNVVPHLHRHVEVVLITEGSTRVTVDKYCKDLQEGDAVVVFPFEQHEFCDRERVGGYIIIADMEQYGELKDYFFGNRPKEHVFRDGDGLLRSLLKAGAEIRGRGVPAEKEVMKGIGTAILSLVLTKLELTECKHADMSITEKLLYICENHYKEELCLDTLARKTGASKYYVSKIFSKNVGISFPDYIATVRVLASKHLLIETDMHITDIASEVGFSSLRSFNRSFSAIEGTSPGKYRKSHKNLDK